ncbi:MAG: hypothetical protein U9R15_07505 [Chloroflexota bacterium]|nr:hypothetical protein [Chloroflexota bacterium]
MRIFITGDKGQLGRALHAALADHTLSGCDLPELDITDRAAIGAYYEVKQQAGLFAGIC